MGRRRGRGRGRWRGIKVKYGEGRERKGKVRYGKVCEGYVRLENKKGETVTNQERKKKYTVPHSPEHSVVIP